MAFSKGTWNICQLMDEYSVLIPALQRNYVHGRDDDAHAQEVREHFVNSILKSPHEGMHLDVVYGVVSVDKVNVLTPIDGQQRLTSLWLVAVYCAQKCSRKRDKGNESKGVLYASDVVKILGALSRFSYEARPIASTFCRWLTSSCQFDKFNKQLAQARRQWGEDPTVRAMCTTLELVAEKLSKPDDIDDVARAVLGMSEHKVTFDFRGVPGDPTDLYVKINARGRTLTQWENLKGKFAESLCCDEKEKKEFENEIENLSVQYFEWAKKSDSAKSKSAKALLPDDAFFALFGRVTDYVLRTYHDELHTTNWIHVNSNLLELATADDVGEVPYTPVEEFLLEKSAKEMVRPLLLMIGWALQSVHHNVCFPYWNKTRTIPEVVFSPKNMDERDFSLFLFDYFKCYDNGEVLDANEFRALRLVANILSDNVTRGQVQRITDKNYSPTCQFNRLEYLNRFVKKSSVLYCKDVELSSNVPMQIHEEVAKASIYENEGESAQLLMRIENLMRGKVRLALFNLEGDRFEKNLEVFRERAERLCSLLENWRDKVNCRKGLLEQLIQALPWDVPSGGRIEVSLDDDLYQNSLRKEYLEVWLQKSLVDQTELDPKSWYASLKKERSEDWGIGTWARDWRDGIIDFINRKEGFEENSSIDSAKGLYVRWHGASNAYYLYTGATNLYSYPIGDYRLDYYDSTSEFSKSLKEVLGWPSGRMNYAGEMCVEKEDLPLTFHFRHDGCLVEITREEEGGKTRFAKLAEIESVGWLRFVKNAIEIAKRSDALKILDETGKRDVLLRA